MAQQERRPRLHSSQRPPSKIPLTYYRSKKGAGEQDNTFKGRKVPLGGRLRRFFASLLGNVILLAVLAFLIYSLIVVPNPKIVASNEIYHSASDYKNAAKKYLGTFLNRNKITLNEPAIAESLQKQFPEIDNVNFELPILAQIPIIHLTIAQPSFILSNNGLSYIVDSQGVAVNQANQVAVIDRSNLVLITDSSGYRAKDGQQVMSASSVQFINSLIAQLQHAKVPIKSITLPPLAQELNLQTADRPYYVKFYLGGDVLQQTGQFLASRHQFDTTNSQPSEYLDVRVSGKVFYK